MMERIRKNDLVVVISGRDKGKQGSVVAINNKKERVLVKGACLVTRHLKAKRQGEKSRITKEESYISFCKVMPICPACKKPCRVQSNAKTRVCHRCKESF